MIIRQTLLRMTSRGDLNGKLASFDACSRCREHKNKYGCWHDWRRCPALVQSDRRVDCAVSGVEEGGMTSGVVHTPHISSARAGVRDDSSLFEPRQVHGDSLNKHPARHLSKKLAFHDSLRDSRPIEDQPCRRPLCPPPSTCMLSRMFSLFRVGSIEASPL